MAERSIPSCSPELTVVVQLAKSRAHLRAGGVGVDDAARFNGAGTQAHSFAGVLLAKAPGREGCRLTNVNVTSISDFCILQDRLLTHPQEKRENFFSIPGSKSEHQDNAKSHNSNVIATVIVGCVGGIFIPSNVISSSVKHNATSLFCVFQAY